MTIKIFKSSLIQLVFFLISHSGIMFFSDEEIKEFQDILKKEKVV